MIAMVGLADCGDDGTDGAAAASTFAKVPTTFGEVSIPAAPKRAVAR
ncbi:hypothetical protein OHA70_34045 [Kribbella sp. NBC_00382]